MKLDWKNGIKITLVLTAIASSAALLICGANAITAETIASNKIKKEKEGLAKVFGEGAIFGEAVSIDNDSHLTKYWPVAIGFEEARVYAASGSNSYGDISLLIGIYSDYSLGEMAILENTESYGALLEEKYIDAYKTAEDKEGALDSVKCGATYGATLIRNMVKEAVEHYKENANE